MEKHRLGRIIIVLVLCFTLLINPVAVLSEDEEDGTTPWVDPTRAPNAATWSSEKPDYLEPDMLIAQSAILIEASTGNVVFEKNADQMMFPASTTKILTAYLALQMGDMDEDTTISEYAIWEATQEDGSVVLPISAGETLNVEDLVYGTIVKSANDGSNAIAEYIAGSTENFVDLMNQTAQMLGCSENTHFANAHGLHADNHYTTARDMAIIAREAMTLDSFRELVKIYKYHMPATNKRPDRTVLSGNSFLQETSSNGDKNSYYYPYATGIKTGFHSKAGYCYVGSATRNNVELISVVFYTSKRGRWSDSRALLEYGFSQYTSTTPTAIYNADPRQIEIAGFDLNDMTNGELSLGRLDLGIRLAEDQEEAVIVGTVEDINIMKNNFSSVSHINWTKEFRAPILTGDIMGILTFYPESGSSVEYELYATRSISARKDAPPTLEEIEAYTLLDPNPLPRFSLEYVVFPSIGLILLWLLIRRLRGKRISKRKQNEQKLPKPKTRTYR